MKKGCLIASGSVVALIVFMVVLVIGGIWFLASEYEKRPKKPGEAELNIAHEFVLSYDGAEASGNTPEATKFAEHFARSLRSARQLYFTEGKAGAKSFTKGRFMTYCFHSEDSIALIIHVPELRRYADDAKLTLSELAWMQATYHTVSEFPEVERLAVGLKGALNYSAILTGVINPDAPLEGIEKRHPVIDQEPLWPYFVAKAEDSNGKQVSVAQPAGQSVLGSDGSDETQSGSEVHSQ